jgi:hypothetical protein
MGPAGPAADDQTSVFEDLHMLGRASEGHRERLGQFTNGLRAKRQIGQHPAPGRIRQRVECRIESILNHVVEYVAGWFDCQPIG